MTPPSASPLSAAADSPSAVHLGHRLTLLEARVRHLVALRRSDDLTPDDPFRGLYLADEQVDRLLERDPRAIVGVPEEITAAAAALDAAADDAEQRGVELRLRQLAGRFCLEALDVELLLVAMAPDLDARFEQLYGYLNDDVSRRRATVGLALQLCGVPATSAVDRRRVAPDGPLAAAALLAVDEADAPFLTRPLRVPDRVTAHLLGDDRPEPLVRGLLLTPPRVEAPPALTAALERGVTLCYLRASAPGGAGEAAAAAALRRCGLEPLVLDLDRLPADRGTGEHALAVAVREARLRGGGVVAGPVEALAAAGPGAVRALADAPCPVVLLGQRPWDPCWSDAVPLCVADPPPAEQDIARLWTDGFDAAAVAGEAVAAAAAFRLGPAQIVRATAAARLAATAAGRPITAADVQAGARAQNAAVLGRLAHRLLPAAGWDDLVVPDEVAAQLRELCARMRHRALVADTWGIGRRASSGRGVTALFAGDSGTGKTLSAEIVAGELGLDLYVIDLAAVVDKYIGETEKNLGRLFADAERVNAVLLFDEADALFGRRSQVSDAHDRYANVEVAYLLQRVEQFHGLAILTTNLRANVDPAFTRRLDAIVDFPRPQARERRRLWAAHLPATLPRDEVLDLDGLAEAFTLSGGEIRNIAVAAAYRAAAASRGLRTEDLIRATAREYRKLGRLVTPAEFAGFEDLLPDDGLIHR